MEVGRRFALLVACSLLSCAGESKDEAQARHEREDEQAQARDREIAQRDADREACRRLRGRVDSFPALAGTPRLDEQRHRVLGQAKGWCPCTSAFWLSPLTILGARFRRSRRCGGAHVTTARRCGRS
jgi:hypothetical protein